MLREKQPSGGFAAPEEIAGAGDVPLCPDAGLADHRSRRAGRRRLDFAIKWLFAAAINRIHQSLMDSTA